VKSTVSVFVSLGVLYLCRCNVKSEVDVKHIFSYYQLELGPIELCVVLFERKYICWIDSVLKHKIIRESCAPATLNWCQELHKIRLNDYSCWTSPMLPCWLIIVARSCWSNTSCSVWKILLKPNIVFLWKMYAKHNSPSPWKLLTPVSSTEEIIFIIIIIIKCSIIFK
jgi:hypothetical protein